jgi:hypothetical protein
MTLGGQKDVEGAAVRAGEAVRNAAHAVVGGDRVNMQLAKSKLERATEDLRTAATREENAKTRLMIPRIKRSGEE